MQQDFPYTWAIFQENLMKQNVCSFSDHCIWIFEKLFCLIEFLQKKTTNQSIFDSAMVVVIISKLIQPFCRVNS